MRCWIGQNSGTFSGYLYDNPEIPTVLGQVVRKPINANPGLKVNQEFNFFYIKVF